MISQTITKICEVLATDPTPVFCIVESNMIVVDNVPSHLVRRIRRYSHIIGVTYSRYRLIVKVDDRPKRVCDARIQRVSTAKHERSLNARYQALKERAIYTPHRHPLGPALPSHRIRIGSTAKCVTTNGGLRPLH